MDGYATNFVRSYVNSLNEAFQALVTDETRELTKVVLGKAFETYQGACEPSAFIHGHADGRPLSLIPTTHHSIVSVAAAAHCGVG
jgi:hypothetical protein